MYLCGRKTPDLDGCVSKSITSMVPYFRKGVLELGVASMDPMFIEEVSMANIPNFRALARNADLLGLSNFTFTSVKFDAENQTIIGEVTYKRIVFNADLNVWAKIIVPINETGRLKSESGYWHCHYLVSNFIKLNKTFFSGGNSKIWTHVQEV